MGYTGLRCDKCMHGYKLMGGIDGIVDSQTGKGVNCSFKFNYFNDYALLCHSEIETILVLSPNDYYFYGIAKLENLTSKYIPTSAEKSFSNVITYDGLFEDESGGTQQCKLIQILEFNKTYSIKEKEK